MFSRLIWLLVVGCMLTLLSYCGRYFFLFEQLDSFRLQWLIGSCIVLLLAIVAKLWGAAAIVLAVVLLHTSQIANLYLPPKHATGERDLRLMSSNLLASNQNQQALLQQIKDTDPDIIVFQEYTTRWHQILSSALASYPHQFVQIIDSPFGIGTYSKIPFVEQQITSFASFPIVDVTVQLADNKVRVLGVHPIPPMSAGTFAGRNAYLQSVAQTSRSHHGPLIVAGDFNAVPWSWQLQDLMKTASLKNSRQGFGYRPTWPGEFALLWIPIDHILYSEEFSVVDFNTGDSAGSDHKPVWADLAFR